MVLKRRLYPTLLGYQAKVDQELGLPSSKWLPQVLELACALGVNSEFPNAHKLFKQWTCIKITEKTLTTKTAGFSQSTRRVKIHFQGFRAGN